MNMSHFVQTNGIRLHYLDHPGDGPTVLLMPGLTANARSFDGLVKAGLVPKLRVLALDLRGRGLSDKPATDYSMAAHGADVMGLLDALGLEQVILGGHSFGGLLTYYLAAHHPERFSRCVVLDAPAKVNPRVMEQIKPSLDRLGMTVASWEVYLERVKAMPYYRGWWDETIEGFYRSDVVDNPDGSVQSRSQREHMAAAAEATTMIDWPSTVSQIPHPLLLLRATAPFGPEGYPPILSREDAEFTVNHIPNGRLFDIKGNHITFLFGESAKLTVAAILSFIFGEKA